ncbi:hypothetical protein IV203_035676 [Nitzschia inconspicua]|uniref:Uncharacterized protein n=1 Tax=Nitzschia inconspicua TaxID=303405 RepID=A0A9K3LEC6_9STRA|nr:hypothetical protein IV203_023285 [Nitzschia inconspicua]KAG7360577.1 hypothetical protein IV203_035676 [Nitzschia inconspicua]
MIIFKGEPRGTIATRELPVSQNANQLALCCQHAAWQDNENMSTWIDECLVPHIQKGRMELQFFVYGPFQMSLFRHCESEIGQCRCPIEAHLQGLHFSLNPLMWASTSPSKIELSPNGGSG